MDTNFQEKMDLINKINTDESRFILNVYTSYKKHKEEIDNKLKHSPIILKDKIFAVSQNVVDLDLIWCKPYFYTKMRLHLDGIIDKISKASKSEIQKNTSRFCKKVVFSKTRKNFVKSENEIDIVDFIKILYKKKKENQNYSTNFVFISKVIDEEANFKAEQLQKAIDIINITEKKAQYEKIYDEVYYYLKQNFVSNNYCDFQNNKCIAQRHFTLYPINRKNGCCFTRIRTCPHLQKGGACNVECMACRLFSCPYLSKIGITYYANEFILLKAFLNKKQRKHLVFDFYKPKAYVLKKISKY